MTTKGKDKDTSNRGFASMDKEKHREIARKGGKSVPPEKRSFSQDPELAKKSGHIGGRSVRGIDRSFSQNRELAAAAGRKGGLAKRLKHQNKSNVQETISQLRNTPMSDIDDVEQLD